MLQIITWTGHSVRLLDQTRLPCETVYVEITDEKQMHDAIRRLVVRGAPAIGCAAAFGAYLGVRDHAADDAEGFMQRLDGVCDYLATSRPTAVNLFWALDRVRKTARHSRTSPLVLAALQRRARHPRLAPSRTQKTLEENDRSCRAIGEHGLELLQSQIGDANRESRSSPTAMRGLLARDGGAVADLRRGGAGCRSTCSPTKPARCSRAVG